VGEEQMVLFYEELCVYGKYSKLPANSKLHPTKKQAFAQWLSEA
jgi:hypothetical protein